jgi:hypothetical protein
LKVKATVTLEFENNLKEETTVDDLEVLGSWIGKDYGQSRPIWEVQRSGINGVYQHHNLGVAILDLLRVAIIELNPEWCKKPITEKSLDRPSVPVHTKEIGEDMFKKIDAIISDAECPDCIAARKHAYSDATTPGFFSPYCSKHAPLK